MELYIILIAIIFSIGLLSIIISLVKLLGMERRNNEDLLRNIERLEDEWKNKYTDDGHEMY
jgi:choline-glycine betaine transporter